MTNFEWFAVEDKLPEVGKEVITYSCYGFVIGKMDAGGKWSAIYTDYETGEPWLMDKGVVTHWCFLSPPPPAPPKVSASNSREM